MSLFSDEHILVRDQARRFLAEQWCAKKHRALLEAPGSGDAALWHAATALEWSAAAVPPAFGGAGPDWGTVAVLAEEIGRGTATGPFLVSWTAGLVIARFGTDAQKSRWLPRLADGSLKVAFAFAEADAPFDAPNTRLHNGRLTGHKLAVPFGGEADLALVTADTGRGAGIALVPLDAAKRTAAPSIDNSRGAVTLRFDDAPAEPLGTEALWSMLETAWVLTAFEQIGGARACLMAARDYALERRTFGQPIGRYQAIKHKLADVYTAIEIAHGNALVALTEIATTGRAPLAAAAARYAATQAYDLAARENIQVHGGIGCTWESDCHIHYRRARALALELGSIHWARERVVEALCSEKTQ
jgi:acyl-CoA dehydrogenase